MPRELRLHLALGGAWGAAALTALFIEPGPLRTALILGSLGYVVFYTVHSFILDRRSRRLRRTNTPRPIDIAD